VYQFANLPGDFVAVHVNLSDDVVEIHAIEYGGAAEKSGG
jgi:hypothetical protein